MGWLPPRRAGRLGLGARLRVGEGGYGLQFGAWERILPFFFFCGCLPILPSQFRTAHGAGRMAEGTGRGLSGYV